MQSVAWHPLKICVQRQQNGEGGDKPEKIFVRVLAYAGGDFNSQLYGPKVADGTIRLIALSLDE